MSDRVPIFGGLLVFVALFTFPLWRGVGLRATPQAPAIKLPSQTKTCVAPKDFMRASHMQLLIGWRQGVVRNGQRKYQAFDGKTYDVKLSGTCLGQCHTSKAEFCDRCHKYAGVSGPYCFDCHVEPKLSAAAPALPPPPPVLARRTP